MGEFLQAQNLKNKESIFMALSSYIRAENFEAKREFLKQYNGIGFLVMALRDPELNSLRLQKRIMFLIYDMVISDEKICEDQSIEPVRKTLIQSGDFLQYMHLLLDSPEFTNNQKLDLREYALRVLEYLTNFKK
mmetsp:Transcript_15117/g.14700  ORF Transcript_15117/g.14700 Transcript_15117/m.14700 type:complete len:134 (+) Transcript_15117:450-851(+)